MIHETAGIAWQQQVLMTLACIWRWRHHITDEAIGWTTDQARAYHQGMLRASVRGLMVRLPGRHAARDLRRPLLDALEDRVGQQGHHIARQQDSHKHVLFFDGGSRGNPGPGGAGAVIVAVNAEATSASIVWSACMSYAQAGTTNNQAEYHGLITGLRAAQEYRWEVEVVGDSALILGQVQRYRPPRHPMLRPLYTEARKLADSLRATAWHHHLRAYNKMADLAANLAMDTRQGAQGLHAHPRDHHHHLEDLLPSDFLEWQTRHILRHHLR